MMVSEYIEGIMLLIMEFTKYFMAYEIILGRKRNKSLIHVGGFYMLAVLLQLTVIAVADKTWVGIFVLCFGLLIPLYFIEGSMKKIMEYVLIVAAVSIMDIWGDIIVDHLYIGGGSLLAGDVLKTILGNFLSLLVLGAIAAARIIRNKKYKNAPVSLSMTQYIIIGIGLVSSLLILAGMQYIFAGDEVSAQEKTAWYFIGASAGCMYVALSIYQTLTANRAEQYRKQTKEYEEFMRLQAEYTKSIMERDQVLRRFKHDMHSHFTVISEYCKKERYHELQDYLAAIQVYSGLYESKRFVGNTVVDAVIYDLCKIAEKEGAVIQITGTIPAECIIEPYDLCILFSNLLSNAVEASARLQEKEKVIYLDVYYYNNQFYLSVKNNVEWAVHIEDNMMVTSKEDKNLHGFGIYNAKQVVEKYGGKITFTCQDDIFAAEILILM